MIPLVKVKPRYINEPIYNEILGITNDFLDPSNSKDSKIYEKNLDTTKLLYSEQILPVP